MKYLKAIELLREHAELARLTEHSSTVVAIKAKHDITVLEDAIAKKLTRKKRQQ